MIGQQAIEKHIEECRHRINNIENFMASNSDADLAVCADNISTLRTVIDAMEKQIAVQHHHTRVDLINDLVRVSICPSCLWQNYTYKNSYPRFCTNCGQKLDWSDLK